ncbi:phosphate ABC transporter, permease protein PstA [Marinococcus halophilus]|uniref:Phosphate transport system permease protein PstA n=1 Tax=Marinococcus halophilus TaxID=1371 RepID=A0A510Y3W9_MARHA|nr:phosphate ABC transporter permease PstA [Marinococcus halophilus]OZT80031.1 phosphate ABC transporter, permease protein PstA [Marinococcus halophilus]GEK58046.1 phosphate transport system permease protein PstA [Marinococcus halophilus]
MKFANTTVPQEVQKENSPQLSKRQIWNKVFKGVCFTATAFSIAMLLILLVRIVTQGAGFLDWGLLTNFASRNAEDAGLLAALAGTIWLMLVTAPVSFILGVGTAVYLEEYAPRNKFTNLLQTNISNLAGVPSVVFGLLGLTIFNRLMGMGASVIAGGLTLSLLVLPIIVVASREAISAVPTDVKHASYAMGATKWQTIFRIVVPTALPGVLTGTILALSRAIGETAPILVLGALTYVASTPSNLFSNFTAMPVQIYNWTGRPQQEFQDIAAAGIIILLLMLLVMNSIAVFIRSKFQKRF